MTPSLAERTNCSAIPIDEVTGVLVSFKKQPLFTALGTDESRFETFDPSTPPDLGFKSHVDDEAGVFICTLNGRAIEMGYYGSALDRQPCPTVNGDPKRACKMLVDFRNEDGSKK